MAFKKCLYCGEYFWAEGAYCSPKCKEEYTKFRERVRERQKAKPKPKKIKSPLARINEKARAAGMTYGQYVAMTEMNGRVKNEKHTNRSK